MKPPYSIKYQPTTLVGITGAIIIVGVILIVSLSGIFRLAGLICKVLCYKGKTK